MNNVMNYETTSVNFYHINGGETSNAELVDKTEALKLKKFGRFAIKRLNQLKNVS